MQRSLGTFDFAKFRELSPDYWRYCANLEWSSGRSSAADMPSQGSLTILLCCVLRVKKTLLAAQFLHFSKIFNEKRLFCLLEFNQISFDLSEI